MGLIDHYLAELDSRLRGPGSAKADLLEEARDGLHDAAAAYREGGWNEEEAQRRAVAEFGPAAVVARDYQAELGMHTGVRTLWKVVLGVPLMQLTWDVVRMLTFGAWTKLSTPTPGWYKYAAQFTHGSAYIVALVGLLALAGTRWLSRRADGGQIAKLTSGLLAAAVGLNLLSVAVMIGATGVVDVNRLFLSVPCGILTVVWVLVSVRLVVLARRSWETCATIVA